MGKSFIQLDVHRLAVVCTVVALLLSGCSQDLSVLGPKNKADMTLADLKSRQRNTAPKAQELDPVDVSKVLATYEEAVEQFTSPAERSVALRRMADLTMVATEDSLIDSTEEIPQVDVDGVSEAGIGSQYVKAIALYEALIANAPPGTDLSEEYYLLSKAYDLNGDSDKTLDTLDTLVTQYPDSDFIYEAQFRRGEQLFLLGDFSAAAAAYTVVLKDGSTNDLYEHSLYKYGWSLYKLGDYDLALDEFTSLLDFYMPPPDIAPQTLAEEDGEPQKRIEAIAVPAVSKTQRKTMEDTLRVISMSFSNLDGTLNVDEYFDIIGSRIYEHQVYRALGELYLYQERYRDAADTFALFADNHPLHPMAPTMSSRVIDTYQKGGFPSLVLPNKEKFVEQYGVNSEFWGLATDDARTQYSKELKQHLIELAQHYHATAQTSKKPEDYAVAARWYQEYLTTFPVDENAPTMNMLLAESLFSAKDYKKAIVEFERTAYEYPSHKGSERAGYFALVAHQENLNLLAKQDPARHVKWVSKRVDSSQLFVNNFPEHKNTPQILDNLIEDQLLLGDIDAVVKTAQMIINYQPPAPKKLQEKAWITYANAIYDQKDWIEAEKALTQILGFKSLSSTQRKEFEEQLATTIYKQGETLQKEGAMATAAAEYLRVGRKVPNASVRANAEYDAANLFLEMEDYQNAIEVMETFRKTFPRHALAATIPAKLSVAYAKTGELGKASGELIAIARINKTSNPELAREALLEAAEMKAKADDTQGAIDLYKELVWGYTKPVEPRMEAQYKLVQLYEKLGDNEKRYFWLLKLVETHDAAGNERSDRTQYLAAYGSFHRSEALYVDFNNIALTQPLRNSLKRKKNAMKQASGAYTKTVQYGVIDFTTASNYKLGKIYQSFAESIMKSERPRGLDELALEEYEILLEDQAFPLEDKAIAIFQTNTERTANNVWDEWVEKSYQSLGKLSPGRYNKQEKALEYVNAIY